MYTRSTQFALHAGTSGLQRDVILKLTKGSTSYYFSMRPMPRGLNSAPIYPALLNLNDIVEGMDIFTKEWRVSDARVTLCDEPMFPNDGGRPKRASELLANLNGSTLSVYQWVEGITDIDNCLLVWYGDVLQAPEVSKTTVEFTAHDRSKLWDLFIPERVIGDEWTDAPEENLGKPIPIIYGEFNQADLYSLEGNGTGLAKAIAYERKTQPKCVIADHEVDYIGNGYRDSGGPCLVGCSHSSSDDGSTSGYAYINGSLVCTLSFDLTATLPGVYNHESYAATNPENISDGATTNVTWRDNLTDDGNYASGRGMWGIIAERFFREHVMNGGYGQGGYQYVDGATWPQNQLHELTFYLYYGVDGATDQRHAMSRANDTGSDDADLITWTSGLYLYPGKVSTWSLTSADVETKDFGDVWAVGIEWYGGQVGSTYADGVLSNSNMVTMRNARLKYTITLSYQSEMWAACAGKEHDSALITDRTHGYSLGTTITDPVLMIEDLYRTHVGLTTEIDTASFDNACNAAVEARIQVYDRTKLSDVVRQLAEQSTAIIVASGAGKLRAIALNEETPTIAATIHRYDLVNDDFRMSKTTDIINEIRVSSRWRPEYERFDDVTVYSDTASKTLLGSTRAATFEWPNVCGSSASYLAQFYVNANDGVWSKEHVWVEFTTPGFRHSHIQNGDWIRFDSDIDALKTAFGESWADKDLLVVETVRGMDSNSFRAINIDVVLSDVSPSPSPSPSPSAGPSADPSDAYPYGRYDYCSGSYDDDITLPYLFALSDGDVATEVGSDYGYMRLGDHYCLEFGSAVALSNTNTFIFDVDRTIVGFTLSSGRAQIYYSDDNNTWTQWGTKVNFDKLNSTQVRVNGTGSTSESHKYWKCVVVEFSVADSSGTLGATEMTATTI